jgi:NADH dehydrogenase [ubiquinone] 1 alpha subcomplex assembly factor 7
MPLAIPWGFVANHVSERRGSSESTFEFFWVFAVDFLRLGSPGSVECSCSHAQQVTQQLKHRIRTMAWRHGAAATRRALGLCCQSLGDGLSPSPLTTFRSAVAVQDWHVTSVGGIPSSCTQRPYATNVLIDRSGLVTPPKAAPLIKTDSLSPLESHLASLILHRGGPLTVAEYMHHALTHPTHGYYTTKQHVFGSRGDFVTSPDISQMFGECIGIWAVATWQQLGCPREFKIVELGPGRGTLMADLLRGTQCFAAFQEGLVEVGLVEVSDVLRKKQLQAIKEVDGGLLAKKVKHYASLEDTEGHGDTVRKAVPTLYIAHEFLDALPVHQFVKRDGAWREVLIDVVHEGDGGGGNGGGNGLPDDDGESDKDRPHGGEGDSKDPEETTGAPSDAKFRFVLAPYDTLALKTVLPARLRDLEKSARQLDALSAIEISPATIGLAADIARRIKANSGAAIFIDYGQDGPYENSLVAIQDHRFVDVLAEPGKVDLSAYVDFDAMRAACAEEGVEMHGPVDQGVLLKALGIDERLRVLASEGNEEQTERLLEGYKRLVGGGDGEMGVRYKAVAMSSLVDGRQIRPVAF